VGLRDLLHQRRLARAASSVAELYLLRSGLELGLFELLREPLREAVLIERAGLEPELLRAWLRAAAAHGLLRRPHHPSDAWQCGALPRWIGDSARAAGLRAVIDQALETQQPIWRRLPELLRGAPRPAFADPAAVARAAAISRLSERAARSALRRVPGVDKALRMLDVGCGEGALLADFLAQRRDAQGVGIELDPHLALRARQEIARLQVSRRAEILQGDFMSSEIPGSFDLVLFHHNLYYFPPARWPFVFARVMSRLKPAGTAVFGLPVAATGLAARASGFSRALADFDLFLRCHSNLHGLPEPEALERALRDAGFREVGALPILPGGLERFVFARAPD